MSKPWVVLVAAVAAAGGCSKYIKVDQRVDEREVRRYEEKGVTPEWSYDGTVVATPGADAVSIRISAVRFKVCSTKEHRVVHKTDITEKRWDESSLKVLAHVAAVASVGVLIGGVYSRYGLGNSFTTTAPNPDFPNDRSKDTEKPSTTGYLTAVGAVATVIAVPFAVGTDALTFGGGANDLGESDEIVDGGTSVHCQEAPAAGAAITVVGQVGTANEDGVFETTVSRTDLAQAGGEALVQVEGHNVPQEALTAQRDQLAKALAAERQRVGEANRVAGIEAESDAEVASGKCSAARSAELEREMGSVRSILEAQHDFVVLDHVIIVATPKGTSVPFAFPVSGEHHVFAFSYSPTKTSGGASESRWAPGLQNMSGARVSSTVVQASPSSHSTISVTGKGCALIVNARKL